MAKKILDLKYDQRQLTNLLNNADNNPIYIHYDEQGTKAYYRIFSVGANEARDARCQAWLAARNAEEMTEEINNYMIGYFEAPAPYSLVVSMVSKQENYLREGQTGNVIDFSWNTKDSSGNNLDESVEVQFTFENSGTMLKERKIYTKENFKPFNVDKYLSVGTNTITIAVTGRISNATTIIVVHYYIVQMDLTSTFNIAVPQDPAKKLNVPYSLKSTSNGVKYLEAYIDGVLAKQEPITGTEQEATLELDMPASGKHHLQLRAYVDNNDGDFSTATLYREFVVSGETGTFVTVALDLAPNTIVNADRSNLFMTAEQYVQSNVRWGYYASDGESATVRWTLGGTSIRTTEANVTDAESNDEEYILSFVPTASGTLNLEAEVRGVKASYVLIVEVNKSGIREYTTNLKLKLQAVGRGNDEKAEERDIWEYEGIKAIFPEGWAWSEQQGWTTDKNNNTALAISGGKQVVIPFQALAQQPHEYGFTFEIDFETYDIDDEDSVVCSIWGAYGGTEQGIKITGEGAMMRCSNTTEMKTQFKQNERIKLSFVVNPVGSTSFPHLAFMMVDGVYERAIDYSTSGRFSNLANLVLGSADGKASIKVYGMRIYTAALTVQQELYHAWIDSGKIATKIAENDIYNEQGIVDVNKMQNVIPVLLVDGLDDTANTISVLENSISKEDKINVNVRFYNNSDNTKDFVIEGARMKLQGTSSLGYPRKNFKLYSKKDNAVMKDFEGNIIQKGLYAFQDGDVPVNTWTLKADFMDSSCTRNASVARIFGDIEPTLTTKNEKGDYALKTPPQLVAQSYESKTGVKFPYNLRTTPNGMAIVMFHKKASDNQYTFLGQYTMLNDKGNEYVYGFHSIYAPTTAGTLSGEGLAVLEDPMCMWMKDSVKDDLLARGQIQRLFDNNDVHCYEILDNISEFSNFNTLTDWDTLTTQADHPKFRVRMWETGFESRYPEVDDDDYENEYDRLEAIDAAGAPLKAFISWMLTNYDARKDSTSRYMEVNGRFFNLTRFEAHMKEHLNLYFCAGYYVYIMRFGGVDQVKKNMMWTTYGERSAISAGASGYDNLIWFPIRYDNDSTVDKRNDGTLFYNYKFDRQDIDPASQGQYYYAGHDSLLWNALEASDEFMTLVKIIDAEFYSQGLTYQNVLHYYDDLARNMWCESIYNENQAYKYISPLFASRPANYLTFLQGRNESHQHWWFRNRFDKYDAMWGNGEFFHKQIHIIAAGAPYGASFYIKPTKSTYFGLLINKDQQIVGKDGEINLYIERGTTGKITNTKGTLAVGDPLYILGANNIEELDLSEYAPYFQTFLEFNDIYDDVLGSNMKKLIIGVPDGQPLNTQDIDNFNGVDKMSRLEYLDMKGLTKMGDFTFLKELPLLKYFYAKNTAMRRFECADGAAFEELQLPDGIQAINISRVKWNTLDYTPNTTLNALTMRYCNHEVDFPKNKQLVFDWLDMLERTYGMTNKWLDFSLTLTGVEWTNVPYHRLEQLMNLGSCSLSGSSYIKCSSAFSSEQMTTLISAFGQGIFTAGNSLIIDCNSTDLILGVQKVSGRVEMESNGVTAIYEKSVARIVATGFGNIREQSGVRNMNYRIVNTSSYGTTIDSRIGIITTTEEGRSSYELTIEAIDNDSFANGTVKVRIRPLTYPTSVRITNVVDDSGTAVEYDNGAYNITHSGKYHFNVALTPSTFDGSVRSYQWTYSGTDVSQSEQVSATEREFVLQVKDLSTDKNETLDYKIVFQNTAVDSYGRGIDAPTISISMFAIIDVLINLDSRGGNEALYAACLAAFDGNLTSTNRFNTAELKSITRNITIPSGSGIKDFYSVGGNDGDYTTKYNVLNYLKNVTNIYASGNPTLVGDVDASGMTKLNYIDLEGSNVNFIPPVGQQFEAMKLGSPQKVTVKQDNNITTLSLENAARLTEVSINEPKRKNALQLLDDLLAKNDHDWRVAEYEEGRSYLRVTQSGLNTEFIPKASGTKIEICAALEASSSQYYLFSSKGSSAQALSYQFYSYARYEVTGYSIANVGNYTAVAEKSIYVYDSNGLSINGTNKSTNKLNSDCTYNMYILCASNNNAQNGTCWNGRFYYCKIWQDGVQIANIIPLSNGKFYDTIRKMYLQDVYYGATTYGKD